MRVDLNTNKPGARILFPHDVALPTSCLNDVRFKLRQAAQGMAYITDSYIEGVLAA